MATITGLTAERMIEMEDATVVDGNVVGNDLILLTKDGTPINAGNVRGPQGIPGATFVVCTSSTRPAYTAPDEGKAIYETDTDLIRVWTGTRWRLQEKVICTSVTRPSGLVSADEGVKIYETDSNLEFTWTGTAWRLSGSYIATYANSGARNSAWASPPDGAQSILLDNPRFVWSYYSGAWHAPAATGLLHYDANSTDLAVAPTATVDAPISTWSGTPPAGRRIKLTAQVLVAVPPGIGAAALIAFVTNSAGTVTYMARSGYVTGDGTFTDSVLLTIFYQVEATGSAMSFKVRVNSFIATANIYIQDSLILVEDIGGV